MRGGSPHAGSSLPDRLVCSPRGPPGQAGLSADVRGHLQTALGHAYSLERELGGGGMARVFVAEEVALGRKVVVKVLLPELAAGVSAERFGREVRLVARLQHPHIVPVLAAGVTPAGLPYYTMPYIEGESLSDRLARAGELPVADVVAVLRDVSRALAYAHARGVIHRDVKPGNVLFSGDAAVVTDFGIAKALDAARTAAPGTTLTEAGTSLGTPTYMAPEQAAGDPATDHRADLYALGVVAYELLAGQPPFTGRTAQQLLAAHATAAPTPVSQLRPATPPALAALTQRLLEKRPADRPQTADEVLRALDGIVAAPGVLPWQEEARGPATAWWRGRLRRWLPFVVAVAACAAGVAAGMLFGARGAPPRSSAPPALRLTYSGQVGCAAISPDGRQWASVVGSYSYETGCVGRLVVQPLPAGRATVLVDDVHQFVGPRWSPAGTHLLFGAELGGGHRGLFVLATGGGNPRLIDSAAATFGFRDAGTAFVLAGRTVRFVDIESGAARDSVVLPADWQVESIAWPAWGAPVALEVVRGGRRHLMLADARLRVTDSVASGGRRPAWLGRASLAYFAGTGAGAAWASGALMLQRTETRAGRFDGAPTLLWADVLATREMSADSAGRRAMVVRLQVTDVAHAARLGEAGGTSRPVVRSLGVYLGDVVISPDGERVAYSRADALGFNTYVAPFDSGGAETMITADSARRVRVDWLGDARLVLQESERAPNAVADLATGRVYALDPATAGLRFAGALADGRWVWRGVERSALVLSDTLGRFATRVAPPPDAGRIGGAIATPDGRLVVVQTTRGTSGEHMLYGWTAGDGAWRRLAALGRRDALHLVGVGSRDAYVATGGERTVIWRVPLTGGVARRHAELPIHCFVGGMAITPDGSRLVCNVTTYDPDAWLLEVPSGE